MHIEVISLSLVTCSDVFVLQDYIGEDGTLHIIADAASMPTALAEMDFYQAHLLTQVAGFWQRRSRYRFILPPALRRDELVLVSGTN